MNRVKRAYLVVAALAISFGVNACSNSPVTLSNLKAQSPGQSSRRASVTIRIVPPARSANSRRTEKSRRTPDFLSPATQSVSVSIAGPGGVTVGPFVGNCTGGFCTQTVSAPLGADTFTVALYDTANGAGKLLSSGSTVATILAGANSFVNLTFNPVVASATAGLSVPVGAGTPTSVPVVLNALDPSGATIVGPGNYQDAAGAPVTLSLSLSDPTGHSVLVGTKSFSSPPSSTTLPLALSYDGTPLNFTYPTLTVSENGTVLSSSVITILPNPVSSPVPVLASGDNVTSATRGPDGNAWFTASSGQVGVYALATGTVSHYPLPNPATNPGLITTGSDGNLWFFEHANTRFGRITPTGILREFPASFDITDLVVGIDGQLWFATLNVGNASFGKIAADGTIYLYNTPGESVRGLTKGPSGRMWLLTDANASAQNLVSFASDGTVQSSVPINNPVGPPGGYVGLYLGGNGKLYASASSVGTSIISLLSPAGAESTVCTVGSDFPFVVNGLRDGTLLFHGAMERSAETFDAIKPDGTCVSTSITERYPVTGPIAAGPIGTYYQFSNGAVTKIAY